MSLLDCEDFVMEAREYVRSKGYVKGEPNLTLDKFVQWVKEKWGAEVCNETARVWLHKMGFAHQQFSKGVYFDGHEREDTVEHRNKYLDIISTFKHRMLTHDCPPSTNSFSAIPNSPHFDTAPSPFPMVQSLLPSTDQFPPPTSSTIFITNSPFPTIPNLPVKRIIRVFHDESTFYSNADQSFHWTDGTSQALKQKSLGQAIMISDFIEEVDGFLQCEGVEARLYLEHQSEGYFNNDMLMVQVQKAIDIFEKKYPSVIGMFIFDNAPSHRKKPDNSLNPERMNVSDGGRQPVMRDTMWNRCIQKMTLDDGRQKGMKSVLEERGVSTKGMNAAKMREELKKFDDFNGSKSIL